tara:strand:- start:1313 stop:1609 length:297 start_codon:yes stop_codon:yes gene_type:complete
MKKFSKYIIISLIVSILNASLYVIPNEDDFESAVELIFVILISIIIYNIFILIIPTIIYLFSKSMTAFKVSFFITCGIFAIAVLAFFASPKNWIDILN